MDEIAILFDKQFNRCELYKNGKYIKDIPYEEAMGKCGLIESDNYCKATPVLKFDYEEAMKQFNK